MARLLYYPPQTGVQDDRVLGIGAHSDYEVSVVPCSLNAEISLADLLVSAPNLPFLQILPLQLFTILRQGGDISALQVLNKQGVWIPAPPIPGTFVVNIADQICRWSNDIFPSTRHRAINRSGVARYSIPLFFGADYDSIVEPFPSLCSSDRPARYAPVKFVSSPSPVWPISSVAPTFTPY
jgi:isopenicillin N synthase-like dioxygenase